MADITADRIIEAYVALRDKRSELKKSYDAEDGVLKEKQAKLEAWLLGKFEEVGSDSFKSGAGTAFRQVDTKVSCGDWLAFWPFMAEIGRYDFMEKRLSSKAIKDYIAEGNDPPPAVTLFNEYKVVVRRA